MPFTLAHPAAILPFIKRRNINTTALVLGSMAPDFEYFVRFAPVGLFGHTPGGFLYYNLPLCLLMAHIFHAIVKKPFMACLPHPLDDWFWQLAVSKWSLPNIWSVWIFAYSALLGMLTHVLWDSFTHQTGWFVVRFPGLLAIIHVGAMAIPIFKILQHGSTLVGLAILVAFCYRWRNQKTQAPQVLAAWVRGLCYGSIVLIGGAACLGMFLWRRFVYAGYDAMGVYMITFLNGVALGTIAVSIIVKKSLKRRT